MILLMPGQRCATIKDCENTLHLWPHISCKKAHGVLALCFVKLGPCVCVFFFSL